MSNVMRPALLSAELAGVAVRAGRCEVSRARGRGVGESQRKSRARGQAEGARVRPAATAACYQALQRGVCRSAGELQQVLGSCEAVAAKQRAVASAAFTQARALGIVRGAQPQCLRAWLRITRRCSGPPSASAELQRYAPVPLAYE